MKNVNVIQLIATLCLVVGCIIYFFSFFIKIPLELSVLAFLLVLAAGILFLISVKRQKHDKNSKK